MTVSRPQEHGGAADANGIELPAQHAAEAPAGNGRPESAGPRNTRPSPPQSQGGDDPAAFRAELSAKQRAEALLWEHAGLDLDEVSIGASSEGHFTKRGLF